MILHDYVLSPDCHAARLMAALTGRKPETQAVDVYPERLVESAGFRPTVNPVGTIPVLCDGALTLTEPAAILSHLAQRAAWIIGKAMEEKWLSRARHFAASLGGARVHDMLVEAGAIVALRADRVRWLRILQASLREGRQLGRQFLVGNAPTVSDISVFPHVALAPDGGVAWTTIR